MKLNVIIRKMSEIFLVLVVFALLSLTYFYWQPYDKCLIQPELIVDKITILDFITRIIFYLLYFSSIILIVSKLFKSEFDYRFKQSKVKIVKLYLMLFAVRLLFDIITYVIKRAASGGEFAIFGVSLILESLFDIVIIAVTICLLCHKNYAERTIARKVLTVVSVVFVILLLSLLIMQYSQCMKLYNERISEWKYEIEYCRLYRDIVVNFSAVLLAYCLLKHKNHRDNNRAFKTFSVSVIRSLLIVLVFILLNFAKTVILPYSTIKSVSSAEGITTNISRAEGYEDAFEIDNWY